MKKIAYITGTRADYGAMSSVLREINKSRDFDLSVIATGMHLMPEFGMTINEIKKQGYKTYVVNAIYEKDNKESMANFIGKFIQLLTKKLTKIKPDIILLLGDRAEMLAGAIVGTYLAIPVVHIHGGEVTSTADEVVRHAITKLCQIHFPATKKSAKRIIKMGENPAHVYIVGAPGLDQVSNKRLLSKKETFKTLDLREKEKTILVIQHPVTTEVKQAAKHMKETMEAIKSLSLQTIVVYPNADAGGKRIISVIEKYKQYPFIKIFKNIKHKTFLSLMKNVDVMVGNSSSGIIEAPSFKLPVVNIGERQEGRERANNIIDVDYKKAEIEKAIKKAVYNKKFRSQIKKCKNPYEHGKSGKKIAGVLSKIKINRRLIQKKICY